jgi:hypothetical protein
MIQDIIEQGEKEFDLRFVDIFYDINGKFAYSEMKDVQDVIEIKDWHKSQQHKLLQSIVEEIETKRKECRMCENFPSSDVGHDLHIHTHNKVLDSLKAKLLKSKE